MKKFLKRLTRSCLIAIASIIVIFMMLAIALYIPPIQNFVVHRVTERLSEETEMDFSIERVRLAFPLDLSLHNTIATEKGDTLLHAEKLHLSVKLLPLLKGRADIDGVTLLSAQVDTKSYIPDTHIKGHLKTFSASSHGIDWENELVHIDRAFLEGANISVALSDTAAPDTSTTTSRWIITAEKADISHSVVSISLPGDTLRFGADIGGLSLRDGNFDTGQQAYEVKQLSLKETTVDYALPEDIAGALTINNLSGSASIDTTRIKVPAFCLSTPHSQIKADVAFEWRALSENMGGQCKLFIDAILGHQDVTTLAKGFVEEEMLRAYPEKPAILKAALEGNIDNFSCDELVAEMPDILKLSASGNADSVMRESRAGKVKFDFNTYNLAFLRRLLPSSVTESVSIPDRITTKGNAAINNGNYNARAEVRAAGGELKVRAIGNLNAERYDFTAEALQLPIGTFLRNSDIGEFSGSAEAKGTGFDPYAKRTSFTASAKVDSFSYAAFDLGGISLNAELKDQQAVADLISDNTLLEAKGKITATLRERIDAHLNVDVQMLDLQKVTASENAITSGAVIDISGYAEKDFSAYGAEGGIRNIFFSTPERSFTTRDIEFDASTSPESTQADMAAGDLRLSLSAERDINTLMGEINAFTGVLAEHLEQKKIDQDTLKSLLPTLELYAYVGHDNTLSSILRNSGITLDHAFIMLESSPATGFSGEAKMLDFKKGTFQLDSVDLNIVQAPNGVDINALVKNFKKRNPNKFQAEINTSFEPSVIGMSVKFLDNKGKTGVNIGARANLDDNGIRLSLSPTNPIIAYRKFELNKDNYIFLGNDSTLQADVDLLADDGTGLKFYSLPSDSVNDITLSINRINLMELSNVVPYMPSLTGMLNGDAHFIRHIPTNTITAMAMINAEGLTFDEVPLGNIGTDITYAPKGGSEHHADAYVTVDGEDVAECSGTYFTPDGEFNGKAILHGFPLRLANGFLAAAEVAMDGYATGTFSVDGTLDKPNMNGRINFKDAHFYSDTYGFKFKMDEDDVTLSNSLLVFKDFDLTTKGKQPLTTNGTVNLADGIRLDLNMHAQNFELINAKKTARSMIYGKVFTNFDGTIGGTADNLIVKGNLEILNRTDATYILKDSPLTVDNRLKDLVQFVDFSDEAEILEAPTVSAMGMSLTLGIAISDAAHFHCNLSEDGKNYADIEGGGNLTLRLTKQGEMSLTGRYTINSGEMKYALPVIPLKTFSLTSGSYIEFTGDIYNPTLNISAKESVKAVVTENDQPRSVAFNVGVDISQPLNRMGLEFTIEAPEDLSVQNQLASMSPEQRGKAAVAMLATGMFMTDESMGSGSNGFKASNALNAFLQSEIQSIAGTALRTIDINLGVESGTSQSGTETTDYSFQFAKRFWGNRISIIIGGKVSTGEDVEYSAESFINNIAIEYRLDKSASRYVRAFYDRNQQDPFEGQIVEGGVGLVLRKKGDRLGELFIFRPSKKNKKKADEKK